MRIGVILGRFQVPYLHTGHLHLIEEAKKQSDKLLILLGVTHSPTTANPLSYRMRAEMIKNLFPHVWTYPIIDVDNDQRWSDQVDIILETVEDLEAHRIILFGSRDSFLDSYTGKFETRIIEPVPNISGTRIRERVTLENTPSFRKGVIYALRNLNKDL